MIPSDRINLIKRIAPALGREEWRLIDLTLKQFGLPWADEWGSGDRDAYVLEMIQQASDEVLTSLAAHLGIEALPGRPAVDPPFWRPDSFRLFLSHLASNKDQATELQAELNRHEISCFVAHKDIEPTREWQDEIELALSTADALLALLTVGFHSSKWTDQEIGFALGRGLLIVSVRMGEEPYGFIARHQAVLGGDVSAQDLAAQLFQIFLDHKQTQKRMTEVLVARFGRSNTFQEAKDNMALLERTKYWDSRLTDRAKASVTDNNQISGSWGVPERLTRLIEQRGA